MQTTEFAVTEKMFDFFMESSKEFVSLSGIENPDVEEHFKFMLEKMLESNDPEIKIDFSRALMFKGFMGIIEVLEKGIAKMMLKGMVLGKWVI